MVKISQNVAQKLLSKCQHLHVAFRIFYKKIVYLTYQRTPFYCFLTPECLKPC